MSEALNFAEAGRQDEVVIHRGLALLAGLLAGIGAAFFGIGFWQGVVSGADGVAGPLALGLRAPHEIWKALILLAGAAAGAGLGQALWIGLARAQRALCPLPLSAALRRSALPLAAFLPLLTELAQGKAGLLMPGIGCAGLAAGVLLLSWLERGDKRKIFFAHPTGAEYRPAPLFVHGSILVLGTGLGFFLQSLPAPGLAFGFWPAFLTGEAVWIGSLLLGALLAPFFSKQTFDQIYIALAIGLLPLALLPLQAAGGVQYLADGKFLGGVRVSSLPWILSGIAGLASLGLLGWMLNSLRLRGVEVQPAWEEFFRELMLILAIPLILYAAGFRPAGAAFGETRLTGAPELLREGEALGAAQAMLLGRLPFKEILLRHGFLTDAVSGLAAINTFGSSLEGYRLLLAYLTPLGLVAVYWLAIFCLPWLWAVLLALLMLTGHAGAFPATRFFFPLVGFIFTLYYLQKGRWPVLLFSGLFTALAVFASYTAGAMALAGHLTLLLGWVFFGPKENKNRLLGPGVYLGAVLLALFPWWLYLGMSNSLGAYFQNWGWALTHYEAIFGLPLTLPPGDFQTVKFLVWSLPGLMVLYGLGSLWNAWRNPDHGVPWNILLLTLLTGLFWFRFLQRGDEQTLAEALPLAAALFAFALFRLTSQQRRLRGIIFLLLAPCLFFPIAGKISLPALAGEFGVKNRIPVEGMAKASVPRLGVYESRPASESLGRAVNYLEEQVGTAETFFVFSRDALLYFLVPRRPAVPAVNTEVLATFAQQQAAVQELENTPVKLVVCSAESSALPGPEVRQYLISDFIFHRFWPVTRLGDWVMLAPRQENSAPDAGAAAGIMREAQLMELPLTWGRDKKYEPQAGPETIAWLPSDGVKAVEPSGLTVTVRADGVEVGPCVRAVRVKLTPSRPETERGQVLVFDLTCPTRLDRGLGRLAWGPNWILGAARPAAGAESVSLPGASFLLRGDHRSHRYVIRLGALPAWAFSTRPAFLELQLPGGGFTLEKVRLTAARDLPVLHAPAASPGSTTPTAAAEKPGTRHPAGRKK